MAVSSKILRSVAQCCPIGLRIDKVPLSFGFEDAISQPLLDGIDKQEIIRANPAMKTPQNVITIVEPEKNKKKRPSWMEDGSFFVFRKLEQDVSTFDKFCKDNMSSAGCKSAEQCGAKLMGRWKNGRSFNFLRSPFLAAETLTDDSWQVYQSSNLQKLSLLIPKRKTANPRTTLPSKRLKTTSVPGGRTSAKRTLAVVWTTT